MPMLRAEHLSRSFTSGETRVFAVDDVTIDVEAGEFVALTGPSGCGKSTLLHLCGGMDRPSSGRVVLDGAALESLGDDALTDLRRDRVGFVFQFFNLLPTLTAVENVALPLRLAGRRAGDARAEARTLLDRVGLASRLDHFPAQLSGGEMQRVAIARALVHRPALVIADEPTGNLDSDSGRRVLELLTVLNRETGVTMLLATHAADVARAAGRVVRMRDGRVEAERPGHAAV